MENQSLEQFVSFPDGVRVILDKVNKSGPLGTSAVVGLFVDCLLALTEDSSAQSSRELFCEVVDLMDYFDSTRGRYSVAVENSFRSLRARLNDFNQSREVQVLQELLSGWVNVVQKDRQRRLSMLNSKGARHLLGSEKVFLYDYSSTVMGVVYELMKHTSTLEVIVSESRTADGGKPIVEEAIKIGCDVSYIPDAAISQVMKGCNVVLVGVETVFPSGAFTNTVGTLGVAICAQYFGVPFVPVTETLKASNDMDENLDYGSVQKDLVDLLNNNWEFNKERVVTCYPAIELIPGALVTSYITEHGNINPDEFCDMAQLNEG
ncbi:MAG TPA: hypothetical protein DGN60_08140 [Chloroflexi bacterium]|nr:hypothetical protein [Chloroflexota bacterium]|tara:strand:+ start:1886 stop:2845 length:960 start_codon:yes stop_codon:yes gene_type:complete